MHGGFGVDLIRQHGRAARALDRAFDALFAIARIDAIKPYEKIKLVFIDTARIDARTEQDALRGADRIVFLYPMYWLNVPPMLKAYIDIVFSHELVGSGALKGKALQLALSVSTPLGEYSNQGAITRDDAAGNSILTAQHQALRSPRKHKCKNARIQRAVTPLLPPDKRKAEREVFPLRFIHSKI